MSNAEEFRKINKRLGCRYCPHHHTKRVHKYELVEIVHVCEAANNARCSLDICPYKDILLKFDNYEEYFNSFNQTRKWPF